MRAKARKQAYGNENHARRNFAQVTGLKLLSAELHGEGQTLAAFVKLDDILTRLECIELSNVRALFVISGHAGALEHGQHFAQRLTVEQILAKRVRLDLVPG